MNVSFNENLVREYRLIGFDNKVGAINDTLSVIEGGEIGSGHSMIAVFEIQPTLSNIQASEQNFTTGNFADIKLEYKYPNGSALHYFSYKAPFYFNRFDEIEKSYRFSTAVIMFGSMLRSSPYTKNTSWSDIISIALESAQSDDVSQQEFIALVQQAKILYTRQKKRKRETTSSNY
jgi:Ca-activated chloride channel family protein